MSFESIIRNYAGSSGDGPRSIRISELASLFTELDVAPLVLAEAGSPEATTLGLAAISSYVAGIDAAALLCSHACCERELASLVAFQPTGAQPGGWQRWGLGKLISHCHDSGLIAESLYQKLDRLNEARRVVAHHQEDWINSQLWAEAVQTASEPHKDAVSAAFQHRVKLAALQGVECVVRVKRV